ncbi:MAG: lysophospholipid acyltransferase family protein [Proteobacteria bacterium]|nr:lysophospholipid acyltransferase family protein [Pseudomonadota bacterium]
MSTTIKGTLVGPGVVKRWLRYPLEAVLLGICFAIFAALPVEMASAIGGLLGRALGPRLPPTARAIRNLRLVFPDMSDAGRAEIVRGMWDNLGRTAAEFVHVNAIVAPGSGRVEIINGDILRTQRRDGRAVILAGAHLANWEISAALANLSGGEIVSVVREQNNPLTQKMIEYLRRRAGGRQIQKGRRGAKEAMRALRGGAVLGLLFDQKMNDGAVTTLFGHQAMSPVAPAQLALRLACPLIPVRVERTAGARFRITIYPPIAFAASGDRQADAGAVMDRLNEQLEAWIRERPEDWMWLHRRWAEETYLQAGL